MQKWILITVFSVILLFAGLFYAVRTSSPITTIDGVGCLPNGHSGTIALHIHPEVTVIINDEQQVVPANIGIDNACMRWVHTHDTTGTIHIETPTRMDMTLGNFLDVWNSTRTDYPFDETPIESVYVDGELYQGDPESLVFKDRQKIVIIAGNFSGDIESALQRSNNRF